VGRFLAVSGTGFGMRGKIGAILNLPKIQDGPLLRPFGTSGRDGGERLLPADRLPDQATTFLIPAADMG
jgi:hypothetical protein